MTSTNTHRDCFWHTRTSHCLEALSLTSQRESKSDQGFSGSVRVRAYCVSF